MANQKNKVPFQDYPGGKSGAGTYQTIINNVPPHRVTMILFAGNDGMYKYMRRAELTVINDLSTDVYLAWHELGDWVAGDVKLYNKDALTFLRYDINDLEYYRLLEHTFIYLDPPYLFKTRRGQANIYEQEFGEEWQHEELLSLVLKLPSKVKVMISHYPNELYNFWLKGWRIVDFKSKTRRGMADERLYMNYELDGHLHDYSYIGKDFRERETHKRKMTNFFAKLNRMNPLLRNAMLQEYDLQYRNKQR